VKSEESDSVLGLDRDWIECAVVVSLPEPDVDWIHNLVFYLRAISGMDPDDVIAPFARIKSKELKPKVSAYFALDSVTFDYFNRDSAALLLLIEPLAKFPPVRGVDFLHTIIKVVRGENFRGSLGKRVLSGQ